MASASKHILEYNIEGPPEITSGIQKPFCSLYKTTLLLLKALRNGAPVDDLPDGAEVLGLAVLVLQIVGVLPSVDTHEGLEVAGHGVLVGAGDETEGARGLVLDEPGPAGALDASQGGVGLLLQVLKGTKVLVDGRLGINVSRTRGRELSSMEEEGIQHTSSLP